MSVLDKVIAAVSPSESPKDRQGARSRALQMSNSEDWLSSLLAQHLAIERAFAAAKAADGPDSRRKARMRLAELLTAHTMAEEAVIYPALANAGEKPQASKAYSEQAEAKMALGVLEVLDPLSNEYLEKLEELEKAVQHHVYEEEGKWFVALKQKLPQTDQDQLTLRYQQEYSRYHSDNLAAPGEGTVVTGAAQLETHSSQ
jgi:hemerythrin superfamily protein